MLYMKDVCRNCNIFTSEVKNNNCYTIKTGHRCNVDILMLIESERWMSLHYHFLGAGGMLWRLPAQLVCF